MTKARLITLLLTLALALVSAPAVMAQDESAGFDPATIPEADQDELLIAYLVLEEQLLEAGVAPEDVGAAIDWLAGEAGKLSPEEADALMADDPADDAADDAEDAAEDTADDAEDAAEDTADDLEDQADDLEERADDFEEELQDVD